jgi:outer membrane protein assembly factor BamB
MSQARRVAIAVAAALLVLAAVAPSPALARPQPNLSLSPDHGPPTTAVSAIVKRFVPGEPIEIRFDGSIVGVGTADRRGASVIDWLVPVTATPGLHLVEARGVEGGDVSAKRYTVRTDWLQFHADAARSGTNPYENVLSPGNVNGIVVYGRQATGGPIVGSAVTCDGRVVVGSTDGNLYGYVPGSLIDPWLFTTAGPIVSTPAAVPIDPCLVVVGSRDGTISAVDAATGRPRWQVAAGAPLSAPILIFGFDPQPDPPGRIVVGDDAGVLRAFDQAGSRLWTTQLDGVVTGVAHFASPSGRIGISQLDPGNRIFATTDRGNVYGIDPTTGAVLIAMRLGAPIVASPAVIGGTAPPEPEAPVVLVGTTDGVLHALFADDLSERWSFRTGGPITTTPAVGNPNTIGNPNLVGDPTIFVASGDGSMYGLADGDGSVRPVWTTPIGTSLDSSPALANGVLYLGAGDSRLRALDALTGRVLFTSDAITCTTSSPVIADGKVVVGTSHGEVITFYLPL